MSVKRWIGNAAAISDLWAISLSGTVVSQVYSMTINGKSITYAASGTDTAATICAALAAVWNAISPAPPPEFQELTAAATTSTVTLTGDLPGVPATITVATSGAATFSIAHTFSATGPNDLANGQNWSGGVALANGDAAVFDNGNVPVKYNLNTSLTGISVSIESGYSGAIGLPFINSNSSTSYAEYRPTSLTLAGGTAMVNGPALTRCNLAFGANTATVRVLATGQRVDKYTPVVLVTGGNGSSELDVTKGDVGVAFYQGTTATFPVLKTSYVTNASSDVAVVCGAGATLTTIVKNGGSLTLSSDVTTLVQETSGGTVTIAAGAVTTLDLQGGTAVYNSTGTLGSATISNNGVLDFDQDPRARTVTNPIQLYGDNATLRDNQKAVNSGVLSFKANKTTKLNVQHGSDNGGSLA
jgi:hypothetical protein